MQEFNFHHTLIVLGLGAMALEMILGVSTGFDLVIVGGILILAGAVGLAVDSYTLGLLIIFILSVSYVFVFRSKLQKKLTSITKATNADALIGKYGVVKKKITAKVVGQVDVEGEIWRASSDRTLDEGEAVIIQSVSGVTLEVKG